MEKNLPELLDQIREEWGMSDAQMAALCHTPIEVYSRWQVERIPVATGATIPPGMENAVPVVGIWKRLQSRFPDSVESQVKWLFTPHAEFGNQKPIDVAASSLENLYWVSYWLDSSARRSS